MNNEYRDPPNGCAHILLFAFATVIIATLLLYTSCSTIKEIPVETVRTEVEYRDRIVHDSIYTHDSIFIKHQGDTIYERIYKYIYRYHTLTDTAYICSIDSIPYTVEVVKEVNRLSGFQKFCIWGFWIIVVGISVIIGYKIRKIFIT